jgi:5-methyltetrahydrofolate--homocysteine methyltransferase
MNEIIEKIYQGVLTGNREEVIAHVQSVIDANYNIEVVLKEGMMGAMTEVGRLFEEGEYFVPELLVAARAMQGGMELLKPLIVAEEIKPVGKIVIGTVKGDLHDIGKNLVAIMLEGAGFEVIDLGADVSEENYVEAVRTSNAELVGLSALLTTTMAVMPSIIEAFKKAGLREKVKIIVGGAPVSQNFADQIGADGYASDASQAVGVAQRLIGV